jgi:hypothetical protein
MFLVHSVQKVSAFLHLGEPLLRDPTLVEQQHFSEPEFKMSIAAPNSQLLTFEIKVN